MTSGSDSIGGAGVEAGLCSFDAPRTGQILDDRYELTSRVGEGTFGEVWRALDRRLGIDVAVKLAKSGTPVERFVDEVWLLAKLQQHPGIVTLRDQWDRSSPAARPFFVMDYYVFNLKQWIALRADAGEGDLDATGAIFVELCRSVASVHAQDVIHRDLKPSNVLLLGDGHRLSPKLADFGEARDIPASDETATQGVGTDLYHSPEQGLGEKPLGTAADVFALAVILFEMLTGDPTPEPGRPWWKIVTGAAAPREDSGEPAAALEALRRALSPRLPDAVLRIVAQALSRYPEGRPTALVLGENIEQSLRSDAHAMLRRERALDDSHASRGFPVIVAISSALGYLFMAERPAILDQQLLSHKVYGARTYPYAWLILPLCGLVLIGTWLMFRLVDTRRRWWAALVPYLLAAVATIPIFKPEVPHGVLVSDTPVWLGFTGLWLVTHYSLNDPGARRLRPAAPQEQRLLFVLFVGALVAACVAPIPIMIFIQHILEREFNSLADLDKLEHWTFLQVSLWETLWLMGPTREIGVACFRASRAAPGR